MEIQRTQIEQVQAELEKAQNPMYQLKNFWNNNWPKIIIGTGTVLVPLGKQIYRGWETKRQLGQAEVEVTNLRGELSESQTNVQALKLKISRYHITLNRLNNAVLNFTKRESELVQKVRAGNRELVAAYQQCDDLKKESLRFQNMVTEQAQEISNGKVLIKTFEAKLDAAEKTQGELSKELADHKEKNGSWNLKYGRLQRAFTKAEKERSDLVRQLSTAKSKSEGLEIELKNLEKKASTAIKNEIKSQKEVVNLKSEVQVYRNELGEAVKKSNQAAVRVDNMQQKLNSALTELGERETELGETNNQLRNIVTQLNTKVEECEALRVEVEKLTAESEDVWLENRALQESLKRTENELENFRENSDASSRKREKELRAEIKALRKALQKSEKHSAEVVNQLNKVQDKLNHQEKNVENLLKKQDTLSRGNQFLTNQFRSVLARLIFERNQNATVARSANELVNNVLDQQEKDQQKSWWEKMTFNLRPQIFFNRSKTEKDPNQDKVEMERFYYFLPAWGNPETSQIRVSERKNPENQKWEVTNKSSNID